MSFFSKIGSFFTSVRNFFADPKTTQAIQNVEEVAVAFVCELATVSSLAANVEAAVSAGVSTQGTTNKIYVASGAVCTALGGSLTGAQATNVKALTAAPAA